MRYLKFTFIIALTIFCLNRFAFGAVLDPSIVLYFSFDEEGDTAIDVSVSGNDGLIHDAKWVRGKYGKALDFDGKTGVGAYVEIKANPTLDITDGITMMAWVYKTDFLVPQNNGETILSKKQGGAYCLEITGWNNAVPEKVDTEIRISGTYHRVASPDSLPLNRWVHNAATYDGDKVRVYVDGEMVTEEAWPGKIDVNGANLYVGAESDGNQPDASHGRFKGILDEVILANRAFSDNEIKAHMEMGSTAVSPEDKLSLIWVEIKCER